MNSPAEPPIPQTVEELRTQLLGLLHGFQSEGCPELDNVVGFLAGDSSVNFYRTPFHMKRGESLFNGEHGLFLATTNGLGALRGFVKVAKALYNAEHIFEPRMVALFLTVMISRWADLQTGKLVYGEPACSGSSSTNAIVNACLFNMNPLSAGEVQAISMWYQTKQEMAAEHESFTHEWWIMHETMNWILVKSTGAIG